MRLTNIARLLGLDRPYSDYGIAAGYWLCGKMSHECFTYARTYARGRGGRWISPQPPDVERGMPTRPYQGYRQRKPPLQAYRGGPRSAPSGLPRRAEERPRSNTSAFPL